MLTYVTRTLNTHIECYDPPPPPLPPLPPLLPKLEDFRRIAAETPFIADLKPSGQYVMTDLHDVGGTPGVLKYMLEEGLLNGDCMTVTGKYSWPYLLPLTPPRTYPPQRGSW